MQQVDCSLNSGIYISIRDVNCYRFVEFYHTDVYSTVSLQINLYCRVTDK